MPSRALSPNGSAAIRHGSRDMIPAKRRKRTGMRTLTASNRRVVAAFLAAAFLMVTGAGATPAAAQSSTVNLVIDYGDGVLKTFKDLPWSKGDTVLAIMTAAKAHPHGINFSYQ